MNRWNGETRGLRSRALKAGLLSGGLALLFLGISIIPAASAATGWQPDPVAWTNGLVLCQFSSVRPVVSVSALEQNGTGLTLGITGMTEVSEAGNAVATANFTGAAWTVANDSTDGFYDLAFSAELPLQSATEPRSQVGSVELRVDFRLATYAVSPSTVLDSVSVALSVANWTWQMASDHLEATFAAMPSFPSTERLAATSEPGWLLTNSENSSGRTLEWMAANRNATAWTTSGTPVNISATPSLALSSPASADVAVEFGSGAGAFQSLSYLAEVGVLLPPTIAGIPLIDFALVGAAAAISTLAVAVVAHRIRTRPSRFIYVDEEER